MRAGLSWESVVRIDGMVKLMLESSACRTSPVESLSMQERVRGRARARSGRVGEEVPASRTKGDRWRSVPRRGSRPKPAQRTIRRALSFADRLSRAGRDAGRA